MRCALVSENTLVVSNIIVSEPVKPCPFAGMFMVGLEDPTYVPRVATVIETFPAGTTYTINEDSSVDVTLSDGSLKQFPSQTTVTQYDTSIEFSFTETVIDVIGGTPCEIGWVYNSSEHKFSAPTPTQG